MHFQEVIGDSKHREAEGQNYWAEAIGKIHRQTEKQEPKTDFIDKENDYNKTREMVKNTNQEGGMAVITKSETELEGKLSATKKASGSHQMKISVWGLWKLSGKSSSVALDIDYTWNVTMS